MTERLNKSEYSFILPENLIANIPLEKRDESKLLVFENGKIIHGNKFKDITKFLKAGDLLVLNETKVLPVRLIGNKKSGAKCEVLLLNEITNNKVQVISTDNFNTKFYKCIVKPAKRLHINDEVIFSEKLKCKILEEGEYGERKVELSFKGIFESVLSEAGEVPLPHYIKQTVTMQKIDLKTRYNTVYSKTAGSSAAPTAGLHFTNELIEKLKAQGINFAYITLNVGLGTFRPVKEKNILAHKMHSEEYEITDAAAKLINETKLSGRRIICVGTTSLRALEANAKLTKNGGNITAGKFSTDIFIHNNFKFKAAGGLITNFHLPESTLIMLVSAFTGYENCMQIYNEAIKNNYRFYSFGDSSLLLK